MAVSSVFPPSASPTEGADLCEIDVTDVAIQSFTLLICLCGLAGNGALFCLLRRKGHTAGIFGLAVIDSLFLLLVLPSAVLFLLEDMSCSPIMPQVYVSFLFQLSMFSCYWVLVLLTAISAKKDMKNLCKLCCHCDLSDRMVWVLWGAQCLAFFAVTIAFATSNSLCPPHHQEHCWVALTSMFAVILLLFAAPMVITRTIDIVKAKCGSRQQQPKRRDIVIFLLVLFTLFLSLWNFLQQLGYCPPRFFTCSPSSTAPSNPSSTSWQGGAGAPAPWGPSGSRSRGSLRRQKDKTAHSKDTNRDTGV